MIQIIIFSMIRYSDPALFNRVFILTMTPNLRMKVPSISFQDLNHFPDFFDPKSQEKVVFLIPLFHQFF